MLTEKRQARTNPNARRLGKILQRARFVLLWERLWPTIFGILMLTLSYVTLSWMGVWAFMPIAGKAVALVSFAAAGVFLLWKLFIGKPPQVQDAISRIEAVSGVAHRPLMTSLDLPAGHNIDPESAQGRLWDAHQKRVAHSLQQLRAGWPKPQIERRDPFALRAVILLAVFIGFNVAGDDRLNRLTDIFDFSGTDTAVIARLDAWVTPPRYTRKAPIFLTRDSFDPDGEPVIVPQGSVVTIRAVNAGNAVVTLIGDSGNVVAIAASQPDDTVSVNSESASSNQADYEIKLEESGAVAIENISGSRKWLFNVLHDQVPEIEFAAKPEVQRSGALQIISTLKDDYGVVRAEGLFEPAEELTESINGESARSLYEAPKFPLSLNRGRVKEGTSKTLRTIVDHPWAGAKVNLTLRAVDEAKQEGRSETISFTLPARRFTNPLARALIEQRRNLAMNAGYANRLADVVDVLTVRPEQFDDNFGALIALAAIQRGLLDARSDDDLRQIVDDLWDLATGLEDGNLSEAERALRDALEALRNGIENGASEEELARLMDDARQALREFMQALAEQAQRNSDTAQNDQQQLDPSQFLDPQDLEKMLDQIEDLAQTGSRDAAKQLLSQLQQMMENLQANRQQQSQQGQSQAQQMLNELGEMIRRQQQLMDETFRQQRQGPGQQPGDQEGQQRGDQGQQPGGQRPGQGPGQAQRPGQGLQQGQRSLADRLQQFMDQLGQNGSDPSGQLGEAQRSMRGAAGELGKGDLRGAGDQQSEALSQLRQGAQALAEQMAGEGQGEGDHNFAQGDRRSDPLGRREGRRGADFGDDVEVPDEIDTQRAREILEAIRRRLGETIRPQGELEYLERLLRSE